MLQKSNSMNILQHCPSDLITELAPGYMSNILVLRILQHQNRSVVLPVQVKICLTCSRGLKDLGSAIWYKFERIFTRIIFVLPICYVARACLGKAVKKPGLIMVRPNSYIVPMPCRTIFNLLYSRENNRMHLVQHVSVSATARHMIWVLNHF